MTTRRERSNRTVVAAAVGAAVSVALPGFLIGALSIQVRDEFGVAEGRYGWAMSAYFLAATAGSVSLGRLAQRIGPRLQIGIALLTIAVVDVAIAAFATGFLALVILLAVAGLCNAAAQTAINLALASAGIDRLGLAIAVKQSGMPAASMLSGLAVPLIALTLGWRWAFVCAAVVAAVSAHTVRMAIPDGVESMGAHRRLVSPVRTLLLAGVASAFLAFGAGALNAWVVESGVDAGLSKGVAGLGLSLGAGLGILMRVGWGLRLDRLRVKPFRIAGWMALIGSLGALALSVRSTPSHVIATLLAFGTGWIWPIFTNFGIVRANAGSAGSATGITQAGVYLGVFAAPLTSGAIIEASGYPVMWLVTAVSMACGALILIVLAERF